MQSDLGMLLEIKSLTLLGDGVISLFRDRSTAMVRAIAMYEQVASSAQCFPGDIHGMFIKKDSTISGDRCRFAITRAAKFLQWVESRFERAAVDGRKRDEAESIEVNRNADLARTNLDV